MPLTLSVGLSKKIGQPDYGSLGASCNVSVEMDPMLLRDDLDTFHTQVRRAYTACRQAVQDELARHQAEQPGPETPKPTHGPSGHVRGGNGHRASRPPSNGNGSHTASQKQLDYLNQLARQIKGLGVRRLEDLSQRMFAKPVAGLSSLDASGLIDMLKAIKAGEVNLDNALNGATS